MSSVLRKQISLLTKKLTQRDEEIKLWREAHGVLLDVACVTVAEMNGAGHRVAERDNINLDELVDKAITKSDQITGRLK